MNRLFFICAAFSLMFFNAPARAGKKDCLKPRIVVMTDIGPADVEPDDNESAVRLLAYADRLEIEAVITTVGWNCDPYPSEWAEYLRRVIDGYATDVSNLMKRSGQTGFKSLEQENGRQELGYWPSVEYLRARMLMGSQRAGTGVLGEDNDTPGSRKIIELVDEADERPIWFLAWGSANTLSQAIWRVRQERSDKDFKAFLHKIRLYTITDQDMQYSMRMNRDYSSHMWLRQEFSDDLMLVWDESAWLRQNSNGVADWQSYARYIQNHGEMGKVYPHYLWGVEGDTPSFLHVMPNGLNDPDDPTQVGWGGMHRFQMSPDGKTMAWTNFEQPLKDISQSYEDAFYRDEFNDFAARMAWAQDGMGNHNPVVVIGRDKGISPVHMKVKAGRQLKVSAARSYDPDGDKMSFKWFVQKSADGVADVDDVLSLSFTDDGMTVQTTVPESLKGRTFHIVCQVNDDGAFNLPSYRRVIVSVK